MAKTIKFNLILDGYPVRTLEELQEHFSLEDMANYFENGLLERWLEVRGYEDELKAVREMESYGERRCAIRELVKIFHIFIDYEDLEKGIAILDYLDEDNRLHEEYKKNAFQKRQIIDDYHVGYESLIYRMEEHRDHMALLKADVIEMEKEYLGLFRLDYKALYFRLLRTAPKAVFAILTRDALRGYWLREDEDQSIRSNIKSSFMSVGIIKNIMGGDLKIKRKNTQDSHIWELVEDSDVPVMVFMMESDVYIRSAGQSSEKWSCGDINGQFRKFDGLEYQCNHSGYELLYMEV